MKLLDGILRSKYFKTSLRVKVVVVFMLPMILVLFILSYMHYVREQRELENQFQSFTIQLGDTALLGMKHAMLRNDQEVVTRILRNYGTNPSINAIRIVNLEFRIVESTKSEEVGKIFLTDQAGCDECHRYPPSERPRVIPIKLGNNEKILRVVTPIPNEPQCQTCHSADNSHLGVLIMDAPTNEISEHMQEDGIYNIAISLLSVLFVTIILYTLIQWLVIKRVGVIYEYLTAFAAGNFKVRIPKIWRTEDEITRLADHFNAIANTLESHEKEQREIVLIRQEAIEEERERIARDLHDGLAQLLAYLNTKISATRLLLKQRRPKVADDQLMQMEEVVQKETTEVRAAIIGLKLIGKEGASLYENLKDYVDMSNRLGDLRILFEHDSDVEKAHLSPEAEIHLLRITQEAIHNIRKHASASLARIGLHKEPGFLVLTIQDDGIGFDTWQSSMWHQPHFGLRTMGERAELIGATFKVESALGQGTRVSVRLKLKES
jgi:signal transduction histidine kinase